MLQQLQIAIYEKLYGNLIADWSANADGLDWSKNTHGAATLSLFVEMPEDEAYSWYDRTAAYRVELNDGPLNIWGGRLEDVRVVDGGIQVTAYGSWRALGDIEHIALWSDTQYDQWFVMDSRQMSDNAPHSFEVKLDNRILLMPQKGALHGASPNKIGRVGRVLPSGSDRLIKAISFDFNCNFPANWAIGLQAWTAPYPATGTWTYIEGLWNITATGTGSQNTTLTTPCNAVAFYFYRNTSPNVQYTNETGDHYMIIENIRIKTTTSASLYADEIVDAIVAEIAAANPDQLSTSTALIQSPAVDLKDVLFENELPADILDRLVSYGDNATPPQAWHAGVNNEQEVYFQPLGYNARTWYIDITDTLEAEVTLDSLVNRVQAVYKDASGETVRSADTNDTTSQARYGIVRARPVSVNTSDSTAATIQRDLALADGSTPVPRTGFDVDAIYDESGNAWPVTYAEIGDTIIVRNFAPVFIQDIDRLTTFRLSEIECRDDGTARLTPEQAIPRLETYLAQQARP